MDQRRISDALKSGPGEQSFDRTSPLTSTKSPGQLYDQNLHIASESVSQPASSYTTQSSTLLTPVSSQTECDDATLKPYIALGCLHIEDPLLVDIAPSEQALEWIELFFESLPEEVKLLIGNEVVRLLDARWIRLFLHQPCSISQEPGRRIVRVYLLPEDWGRKFIDRRSKALKAALRELLHRIDISPAVWSGDYSDATVCPFDPWASVEDVSLYYLFNNLKSPDPSAEKIKNRYSRNAVWGLLESDTFLSEEGFEQQSVPGLKTRLYPYQARSASTMIQRESAPQPQLDPRLEDRVSPTGETFYFGARDGSFLKDPRLYDGNRGGILAETMGLGKTIICLAVILATKGHMPQIPGVYQSPPPVRKTVGSLKDMAASIIGRNAIPGEAYLEQLEAADQVDFSSCKATLRQNMAVYEIPVELPRMNRTTTIDPPRQLVICKGTIIVVPRNLLHQWQAEINKHVFKGSLKVLVMDTKSKRASRAKAPSNNEHDLVFETELPATVELMNYDIILFTHNRFREEIRDGQDQNGRRLGAGVPWFCTCPYIGASRVRDCRCLNKNGTYESPIMKLHWLRIIIDEGHNFSSGSSDAVRIAMQLQIERRWVVSGTPAKSLVGAEVDLSTLDENGADSATLRQVAIDQRKTFSLDKDNTAATRALGLLASNFLMVQPWSESGTEGRLEWDDYIYRHEHHYRKTYSGYSICFKRVLEGLVVKTRPEDVEKDITLPPMKHRTVYLKPCWFDKMTANLFIQVLRANAITSERSDVDYLFHPNSIKPRHSLVKNLRQSNFTWTGFSAEHVASTIEISSKYLNKVDKRCSVEDASLLLESSRVVSKLLRSERWIALSKAHEIGIAVEHWPMDSEEAFALVYSEKPAMIGVTQLLDGQRHVDGQMLQDDPSKGLDLVGRVSKAKLAEKEDAEDTVKQAKNKDDKTTHLIKSGVPSSCVEGQPAINRRSITSASNKASPKKSSLPFFEIKQTMEASSNSPTPSETIPDMQPTARPKKRRLTLADEVAELPHNSVLNDTQVVGTTSAKLTYLLEMVMRHQADKKIIIFYDGDDAAYYIAQCLEMLYVNHRIYARTLNNTTRSQYVALFNNDPDLRVLLIDVACGALGLNLNAASIVLIVNPINRPSIEAQAIKRAHRIGQTREVLVETLVLEGTIEEAIFKRAKRMSRMEHLEAKNLEDDDGIVKILQNAEIIPIAPEEEQGLGQFALLEVPQRVFGRPGREKYHKYAETKSPEKARKKARTAKSGVKEESIAGSAKSPPDHSMDLVQLP
jgi:SNF2 family DNA or RNA helicase